jgi:hypothetical protein
MSKTAFHLVGRRLSAIVRRQTNGGGPSSLLFHHSALRPADAGATAGTPTQKPAMSKTAFHLVGRRLSAIVRRQTNGGGPSSLLFHHSALRPADAGATAGTPAQKPAMSKTAFHLVGRRLSAIVRRQTNGGGPLVYLSIIFSSARVACVKFSKKKSEKMCRIWFGFFEKRTIAFRLALPLPQTEGGWGRIAPPQFDRSA